VGRKQPLLDTAWPKRQIIHMERAAVTQIGSEFFFRMLFCLGPVIEAVVLFATGGINLFWSSIFGLGGFVVEWVAPPHGMGAIDLFGILVWPILVLAMLHWLAGRIWALADPMRRLVVAAYLLSLAIIGPLDGASYPPAYQSLPLYVRLIDY
jgi:hypothetical protein